MQAVCSQAINLFKQLVILLKPVLPKLAADAEQFLNVPALSWNDLGAPLGEHQLNPPFNPPLLTRVDAKHVAAMIESSKEDLLEMENTDSSEPVASNGELEKEPPSQRN